MENSEKSSSPAPSSSAAGGKEKIEKQARQLAYDTRYKVKQSMAAKSGSKLDPAAVRKAYIAQLGKSPSSPPVKSRAKEMLVGEEFINTDELVHDSAASALHKVFVEKYKGNPKSKSKKPEGGDRRPGVGCEDIKEDSGEKTYKVRVTDKKSNNTYVRMATRAKISELRSNPNISSVEMTGYGSPTKSEKHKGSQTAAVKSGKSPKDYDGDNKLESPSAEYKGSKDKAIKKALRSENFDGFLELVEKKDKKKSKITGEGVNNKKLIKVFPDDVEEQVEPVVPQNHQKDIQAKQKKQSQLKKQVLQKKLQAVRTGGGEDITASYQPEGEVTETEGYQRDPDRQEKDRKTSKQTDPSKSGFTGIGNSIADIMKQNAAMKKKKVTEDSEYGYDKDGDSLNPKDVKKKNEKDPNGEAKKQEEEDPRGMATKINLVRNKLRAMGLKMSHEPEGETIEESEAVAQGARKRAQELGAARRKREGVNRGVDKNERAGYKLAQAASSSDSSPETQRTRKKRPAGDDTSQIGHYKNRDAKRTTSKTGKPLKKPVNKLSLSQRVDHHSNTALNRRDPKQNPKHTANESVLAALEVLDIYTEAKKKGLDGKACWDGYKLAGTKKKGGKTVDDCVKVEHHQKDADGKVIDHGDGTPSSVEEAKVDTVKHGVMDNPEKEKARNARKFGNQRFNQGGQTTLRRGLHWSKRGEKKVRGAKQLGEEGYDRMRDDRLVKYGIGHDGSDRKSTPSRRTPDNQKIKGKTVLQKETEKKYGKGATAMDVVKAKIKKGEL